MLKSIGIMQMLKMNYDFVNKCNECAIVLLHGWGLSKECFDNIASLINVDLSILKIDLPGFGKSEYPKDYFDTHEYAYQIFLLIKKLKLNNIILVGHSFGGRLAILLSSIYNINVEALVLTSSAGLNRFSLLKWLRVIRYKFLKYLVAKKVIAKSAISKCGSDDYKKLQPIMKGVFVRVVNQDLTCYLSSIVVKRVYLVWDRCDNDTPYWICKKLKKHIINSQVVCYGYGGHFTAFKNMGKFAKLLNEICIDVKVSLTG